MAKKMYRYNKGKSTGSEASSLKTPGAEFTPDYSYVKKDLRRIGMLAGFFFAVMLVLSFIL